MKEQAKTATEPLGRPAGQAVQRKVVGEMSGPGAPVVQEDV